MANYYNYSKKPSKQLFKFFKKSVVDVLKVVLVVLLIFALIGLIGSIFSRRSADTVPNETEPPTTSVTIPTEAVTDPTEDVTEPLEDSDSGLLMYSAPGAYLDGYYDDGTWERWFDGSVNETVDDASSAIAIPFG